MKVEHPVAGSSPPRRAKPMHRKIEVSSQVCVKALIVLCRPVEGTLISVEWRGSLNIKFVLSGHM